MSILILGDLGAGDSRAAVGWQRQLARLQQHASPMLTLSPAFSSPDGKLFCGSFRPNPFNDYFHLPRHPGSTGFAMSEPSQEVIDNILTWLAPLPLVDAGLLRRLRVEMQWGNSALEAVIWNHSSARHWLRDLLASTGKSYRGTNKTAVANCPDRRSRPN